MHKTTKFDGVQFEHHDELKGDVVITRGDATLTVPMSALRKLVAESVRADLVQRVATLKPETLLRGLV